MQSTTEKTYTITLSASAFDELKSIMTCEFDDHRHYHDSDGKVLPEYAESHGSHVANLFAIEAAMTKAEVAA